MFKKTIPMKKTSDIFYRYQMPEIEILFIHKKTQLCNLNEISKSINIKDSNILFKYISKKLNTMGQVKNDLYFISGNFDKTIIQNIIYDYINSFLLCKTCNIPEIQNGKCLACGNLQ